MWVLSRGTTPFRCRYRSDTSQIMCTLVQINRAGASTNPENLTESHGERCTSSWYNMCCEDVCFWLWSQKKRGYLRSSFLPYVSHSGRAFNYSMDNSSGVSSAMYRSRSYDGCGRMPTIVWENTPTAGGGSGQGQRGVRGEAKTARGRTAVGDGAHRLVLRSSGTQLR